MLTANVLEEKNSRGSAISSPLTPARAADPHSRASLFTLVARGRARERSNRDRESLCGQTGRRNATRQLFRIGPRIERRRVSRDPTRLDFSRVAVRIIGWWW